MWNVSTVFSQRTLDLFEDASASVVLRELDRAFEGADIRMGEDPGGLLGSRRTQFRRYVAGVDQNDPQQLDRLGRALGSLINAVATSKEEFLVKAAERDGFLFVEGVFRPVGTTPSSFAVTHIEDLALIHDCGRRLHLIANDNPKEAIGGAMTLVESICRTALRLIGEPAPVKSADLGDIAKATLNVLEGTVRSRRCLVQLAVVVASVGEMQSVHGSPRHARLAVGAAVTFAVFVAEMYLELTAGSTEKQ
jgi:hypothetical protein